MNCNLTKPLAPGDRQPDMPGGYDLPHINSSEKSHLNCGRGLSLGREP